MGTKKIIILVLIVAIVGGALWYLGKNKADAASAEEAANIPATSPLDEAAFSELSIYLKSILPVDDYNYVLTVAGDRYRTNTRIDGQSLVNGKVTKTGALFSAWGSDLSDKATKDQAAQVWSILGKFKGNSAFV